MTEMDNNNNKSSNNSFGVFLFGALVGAVIVLLLVTKKGKKILKAISEEGEGKISNIINKIENSVDLEDESLENEQTAVPKTEVIKEAVSEKKPKVRRFFRGVSLHVN